MKGYVLVLLQFALILLIVIGGPIAHSQSLFLCLQLPALVLGVWALVKMGKKQLSVLPQPLRHSVLRNDGPYRFIRHPMYTAVLLFCLGSVLQHPNAGRLICWLLLQTVLVIKINYEETLLLRTFPTYAAYARRTARLFPGIW